MNWLKIIAFCASVTVIVLKDTPDYLKIFCLLILFFLVINFIIWIFKSIFKGGRILDNQLRKSEFTLFPGLKKRRLKKQQEEFEKKKNEISWKVWNDN